MSVDAAVARGVVVKFDDVASTNGTFRSATAPKPLAVVALDIHPMEVSLLENLPGKNPKKVGITAIVDGKKLVQFEVPHKTKSWAKIVRTLDDIDREYDMRLVGDNVALLAAFASPICLRLNPPRRGPQYRLEANGSLRWTPWLDIESLQLGFMRSSVKYMHEEDPVLGGEQVEEALSRQVKIPPPLSYPDYDDPKVTSERCARMYFAQLKYITRRRECERDAVV